MPLHLDIINSMQFQKCEDIFRNVMGRVSRGRAGIYSDPHYGGAEGPLVVGLSVWGGEEASGVNRVALVYGRED